MNTIKPILIFLLLTVAALPARAELRIDITRGTVEPIPIAVTDFLGETGEEELLGRQIAKVIKADLKTLRPVQARRPQGLHRGREIHRDGAKICQLAGHRVPGVDSGPRDGRGTGTAG